MFQLVEPGLTQREQQVVELLMQGCENEEIAKELGIAPRTVKAYFNRMFLRFGIADGVKRVKLAIIFYRRQRCQEQSFTEDMYPTPASIESSSLSLKGSKTATSPPKSTPPRTLSRTTFEPSTTNWDSGIELNSHSGTRHGDSTPPSIDVEEWEHDLARSLRLAWDFGATSCARSAA